MPQLAQNAGAKIAELQADLDAIKGAGPGGAKGSWLRQPRNLLFKKEIEYDRLPTGIIIKLRSCKAHTLSSILRTRSIRLERKSQRSPPKSGRSFANSRTGKSLNARHKAFEEILHLVRYCRILLVQSQF